MATLTTHQAFFKQTSQLASELKKIESQVKAREQQLLSGISGLTSAVRKMASSAAKGLVQEALNGYFDQTSKVLESWEKKVNNYDAGLSFREQFGDSLLVFIYGKVKAGKSSLGNYVACGRSAPDEQWLAQIGQALHKPHYFGGETNQAFGEAINHKQGFQVGEAETTSCIQGFSVPGLTWVDSPGLHSKNIENGELSQKYAASADLIIYPMNSAQPGRQSDLQELETLLKAGKRILVLITRCDTMEQDVDDDGNLIEQLVMKSAQSRQDQEQHVQSELSALCRKLGTRDVDTSVLTVSVGYAEANNSSEQAMQESGMQELFAKLQNILHSDGIKLKKRVPEDNLQAFYRLLLADEGEMSLSRLLLPLDSAVQQLTGMEARLDELRKLAHIRIEHDFAQGVESLVEEHVESRDIQAMEQALQQLIEEAISAHYREPLKELYQEALGTLQAATQDMGLCVGLEIEAKTKDITVDVSRKSAALGMGAGAVAGGIAGFFLGGPLGMAIGGTLGSMAGGAAGSTFSSQEQRTIEVGDNREEIKTLLLDKGTQQVDQILLELNMQTVEQIISPVRDAIDTVRGQALCFHSSIKEQAHV